MLKAVDPSVVSDTLGVLILGVWENIYQIRKVALPSPDETNCVMDFVYSPQSCWPLVNAAGIGPRT